MSGTIRIQRTNNSEANPDSRPFMKVSCSLSHTSNNPFRTFENSIEVTNRIISLKRYYFGEEVYSNYKCKG